jgi:predicted phage baseplate assembly protein
LQPVNGAGQAEVIWSYAQGGPYPANTKPPLAWSLVPPTNIQDETQGFQQHGRVALTVPTNWSSENPKDWNFAPEPGAKPVDKSLFWLGVRINNRQAAPLAFGLAHVLFNSVPATNALTIRDPEPIGISSGQPFQSFELRNRPLYKNVLSLDRYDHLRIQVRQPQMDGTFGDWTTWARVEEFPVGDGQYYRLDPITGVIDFGDFHPTTAPNGHGTIPPKGSEIRAESYRYVAGGANGNIAAGAASVIRTPLPGVASVQNLGRASGGSNEESIEETKRRGPELLRNRVRAVTLEDYEFLAQEASPEVKKVRALPARLLPDGTAWTFANIARVPGSVNVIVVPDAPPETPRPIPTDRLLRNVSDYLEIHRIVTTTLQVTTPRYLPINATVEVQVWNSAITAGLIRHENDVADEMTARIKRFLHPLYGGLEGHGWEVGQDLTVSTLFDYIRPAPEIGLISRIEIAFDAPGYTRPPFAVANPTVWVQLADFELLCSGDGHKVTPRKVIDN